MENKLGFIILDDSLLPRAAALFREAFAGEPWNDDWSDEAQLLEYIKDISMSRSALNYGLMIDGELAAAALGSVRHWWEGTNYNIEEFFIAPNLQGQGLGTRFMELIEEDIKKRGLAGIFLQTDSDKPAYRFYKKNGFGDLGTHVSLYKGLK
ncbi:MAG: GNAT family N-acetyltransferase [Ruminococcus sp.]|nr:GNAT family N-acetyltransferase [Ruminococcus sp.]